MIECSPLPNKTWQDVELCGFSIDNVSAPFACATNRNSKFEDDSQLSHGEQWEVEDQCKMKSAKCKS